MLADIKIRLESHRPKSCSSCQCVEVVSRHLRQLRLMESEKGERSQNLLHADRKFFSEFCTRKSQAMENVRSEDHGKRTIPSSLLTLEVDLHQAIDQAHSATHDLQMAIGGLQDHLRLQSCEVEKWKRKSIKLEEEVVRWRERCRRLEAGALTFEKLLKAEAIKFGNIQTETENLKEENASLRVQLEQRNKELYGWKEDCIFYAMKLVDWDPAVLTWSPSSQLFEKQEKQEKKVQSRTKVVFENKKDVNFSKSSITIGERRQPAKSGAAMPQRGHVLDLPRTPRKEKCFSCKRTLQAPASRLKV